jgi:type II secretory pathway component GspD/PulD (secretin)
MSHSRKAITLCWLLLASAWCAGQEAGTQSGDQETTRMISVVPLRSISFAEAEQVITPFLSEDGRLVHLESRHAVVIIDLRRNVDMAKQILSELDVPPVNIRVMVTFDDISSARGAEAGAHTGGITITRTERGRTVVTGHADVFAAAGQSERSDVATQFLLTREGRPASIWVGETVAEPVWIFEYGYRHGWWRQELVWQDIGVRLQVLPRLIGSSTIDLEVYPRLTVRGDQPLSLDARELSTHVFLESGQTVTLGGLNRDQQEVYARLFGIGQVFNGRRLAITVRADIMPVPGPPLPSD